MPPKVANRRIWRVVGFFSFIIVLKLNRHCEERSDKAITLCKVSNFSKEIASCLEMTEIVKLLILLLIRILIFLFITLNRCCPGNTHYKLAFKRVGFKVGFYLGYRSPYRFLEHFSQLARYG